jgi:caspase domain-containing protein/putative peptidoglycan binding protein
MRVMRPNKGRRAGLFPFLLAILLAFALLAPPALAAANQRVALVIGNADYKVAPKLANPVLDARAIAETFKRLGFKVVEGYDLSAQDLRATLSEFSKALAGSDAAVVYYAGHGVAFDGENYLLPIDIDLKTPTDLDLNAISVSQLLRQMRREERANVIILDACRDNPFAAELERGRYRGVVGHRGLNRIEGDLARGALIAFASDPNATALDGEAGEHSPFTKALIDHLGDQGVAIDTVMQRVRSEVWQATKNQQLPWVNTSIIGEFDLNPAPAETARTTVVVPEAPAAPTPAPVTENLLWESAQHSNLVGDYQAYLAGFPNGVFAAMARNRIAVLTAAQSPPPAPTVASAPAPVPVPAPAPAPTVAPAPAPPPVVAKAEPGPEEIEKALDLGFAGRKELQLRLTALKFDPGPPDGAFGDRARAAIREWQKRRNLSATGYFDSSEVASLKSESEAPYQQLIAPPAHPAAPPKPIANVHPAPLDEELRHLQPARPHCGWGDPTCGRPRKRAHGPAPEDTDREIARPEPHQTTDQFLGGCQEGFHVVPAPTPSGTRCVQNGF